MGSHGSQILLVCLAATHVATHAMLGSRYICILQKNEQHQVFKFSKGDVPNAFIMGEGDLIMLIKTYIACLFSQHLHKVITYLCLLTSFFSFSWVLLFLPIPGAHSGLLMIIPFYLKVYPKFLNILFQSFVTCNHPCLPTQ